MGLEPIRAFAHDILSVACLPIPPPRPAKDNTINKHLVKKDCNAKVAILKYVLVAKWKR